MKSAVPISIRNVSSSKPQDRTWNNYEHNLFVETLKKYGKDWEQVKKAVKTRTPKEISNHTTAFRRNLQRRIRTEEQDKLLAIITGPLMKLLKIDEEANNAVGSR